MTTSCYLRLLPLFVLLLCVDPLAADGVGEVPVYGLSQAHVAQDLSDLHYRLTGDMSFDDSSGLFSFSTNYEDDIVAKIVESPFSGELALEFELISADSGAGVFTRPYYEVDFTDPGNYLVRNSWNTNDVATWIPSQRHLSFWGESEHLGWIDMPPV